MCCNHIPQPLNLLTVEIIFKSLEFKLLIIFMLYIAGHPYYKCSSHFFEWKNTAGVKCHCRQNAKKLVKFQMFNFVIAFIEI